MLNLQNPDVKQAEVESLIVGYIDRIIEFDARLGRTKQNFFPEDLSSVTRSIEQFRAQGFRIFIGGGNMFFLKIERKLTGWVATCIHSRGLARRKIQVKEMINA